MGAVPRSFIREILKVTERPGIISFAGGLPNPVLFPVRELAEAAREVLGEDGRAALQYSTTEGYAPLREWIAKRYLTRLGLAVSPDEILITNGSQQCLDLIGKVFINSRDPVAIERPGYLGAIQAFSLYEPIFRSVPVREDGPDIGALSGILGEHSPRLFYGVPNFQNPSGIRYSVGIRKEVADALAVTGTIFVEDDAYGELSFSGDSFPSLRQLLPEQTVISGSFSKIIAPGMRMGWIVAPPEVRTQLVTAKQGSDLHSNYLCQRIIHRFLTDRDIGDHISRIREAYRDQCGMMMRMIGETFPAGAEFTRPEGGMFLWVRLPAELPVMKLFERAMEEQVAFVPGTPFFVDGGGGDSMRLNFSNSSPGLIVEGITRLGKAMRSMES
jgi:2-aminoadipate transaminase